VPLKNTKPIRDPTEKWFLSKSEYPEDTFPDYLSGWMYFGRTEVLGKIANYASENMPYLFIDDMFLLGMAREKVLGTASELLDIGRVFANNWDCCMENINVSCPFAVVPVSGEDTLLR